MLQPPSSLSAVPSTAPPGYVRRLAAAQFGIYMAIIAPVTGGLSVKIQHLVGADATPARLGLVTGAGAAVAMVCQPLAGRLSDRCTSAAGMRRPFIVSGLLVAAVGLIACGWAPNVTVLLIAWCIAQAGANFAMAGTGATIADQVPDAKRGSVSGIVGSVTSLGITVGAVLLFVLPTDLLRFAVPAILGLLLGLWFALRLRDRIRQHPAAQPLNLRQLMLSFVFNPRKHPDFAWAWLSKFFIALGFGALPGYLTLFLAADFGVTDTDEQLQFNAIANVIGLVALVLFSVLGGYLSDRIGRRKPFIIGAGLVMAGALAGIALTPALGAAGMPAILVLQVVLSLGAGMFFAVDQALCLHLLPDKDDTAKDLGVLNIANTLPQSLSPFLAGVLFIPVGNALFDAGYPLLFLASAVFCAIASLAITRIKNSA
ncbi:MFS transporter [Actinoplanes derwentensis]|nr:MFS transporter [Actinoplanes derwentensis]GID90189.1 MFS transporter [Actinoplanes derwentensis]